MLSIPVLAYIALRSAAVQTYFANMAANFLSNELEATITVGGVNISAGLNIVLEDVEFLDQKNEPFVSSHRVIIDFDRISSRGRFLLIDRIRLVDAGINTYRDSVSNEYNFNFLIDYITQNADKPAESDAGWDMLVRSVELVDSDITHFDPSVTSDHSGFSFGRFALSDINLGIQDIILVGDTLSLGITGFSFTDNQQFELQNMTAEVSINPVEALITDLNFRTGKSSLAFDIQLNYDGYEAFQNFYSDVKLALDFTPSSVNLSEIAYFLGNENIPYGIARLSGKFSGFTDNLKGDDLMISYGAFTEYVGGFTLVGLPDFSNTFLSLDITRFSTNATDIQGVTTSLAASSSKFYLPEVVHELGTLSFNGNITGFVYNFVAYGQLRTARGVVSTNIAIVDQDRFQRFEYIGKVESRGFDLNNITEGTDDLGKAAFSVDMRGSGSGFKDLEMRLRGEIGLIEYKNYSYEHIKLAGDLANKMFSGSLSIKDPNLFLDFSGMVDFRREEPTLNFIARIDDANLTALNIFRRDSLHQSLVTTMIRVDGSGKGLADISGEIIAYSTVYYELTGEGEIKDTVNVLRTDVIALENRFDSINNRELRFYSDFLDISIEGRFDPEKIAPSFIHYYYQYAPTRFASNEIPPAATATDQQAGFEIHIKSIQSLANVFYPGFDVGNHSFITGNLDTKTSRLSVYGSSEYVLLAGKMLVKPELSIESDSLHLEVIAKGNRLYLTDSVFMEQFFASALLSEDTLMLLTQWDNQSSAVRNLGNIKTRGVIESPTQTTFSILPSYAYLNDSLWSFGAGNQILIDTASIEIKNFKLYKNDEYLIANGVLSDLPEDKLKIDLNDFNIESMRFLLGKRKIDFSGVASGELTLSSLRANPGIIANLLIHDFAFNNDHLGDLSIHSLWDATLNAFDVNAEIIYHGNIGSNVPVKAFGYFYPDREDANLDIDIVIENLKMSVFGRYLQDFASGFRGLASGQLRLEGPMRAPELSGKAKLVRTGFRVDYLNTTYSFAHDIEIGKNYFRFDNLLLNDTIGNSALATGIIRHRNFFGFDVDITLRPQNLIVLNTRSHQNELFYGKAFASGLVHVHGPVDDIAIDVTATANRGTQFFLPLDYSGEVSESSFISFVSDTAAADNSFVYQVPKNFGFSLNFDISVTPDAEIQIIFDSKIGDIMRGAGFGDLQVEVDKQGTFSMYGDYTIQEGDYLFTLQNLINKRFRIEQGGTIRWSGDPYNADIDIRALYRLRTSLFDLAANQTDTSDIYRRRVPVETVLHLTNKLFNPSISFDIQLPSSDETTREMIERIITTDQEMNRQVFSLLILNRFVPPEDGFNSALSYGMGTTSTELLSNQLSNWLSQISNDFDIGVNYRPGDEISAPDVELALSTQLFNDRVVVDGNLGLAGNHPAQTQRTSNIIGDVNVEVKITPEGKFRVKAFNRSNTFDILNTNAPYTQGVGVFYRREFDNLSELFRQQRQKETPIPEIEDVEDNIK